jgi:ABC-type dipeptide/oligopeptide/nickel transport system permease subunit
MAEPADVENPLSWWRRLQENDVFYSFTHSPLAVLAASVTLVFVLAALCAPLIAPFDPFDPAQISLWDGKKPPAWEQDGDPAYLLGTDNQGRDMLSTLLYGGRISLAVGFASVALGMVLGVGLGVISGYLGGWFDAIIMRLADVQLTIPGILTAILINGILRSVIRRHSRHRAFRLASVRARGARGDPGRGTARVRAGRACHWPGVRHDNVAPHIAQRHATGAGPGHHWPGACHHR